jgi:aryl-alcohol dehydrogenase-like predicted oxidoreductase
MRHRLFEDSPARPVSEIGLGCWQLGGGDWGAVDDATALSILRAAADAGVTFFDTADVYGAGRSETLIGRFRREAGRGGSFIATKLGRGPALYPDRYTEAGVRRAVEDSLRRLGVEALDLVQLHCVPPEVLRRGEIFDWLRGLRAAGLVRAFGASVETVEEGLLCLGQEGLRSLQVIFNVFRQLPAAQLLPAAAARRVAVVVRLPLASGVLSGRFTRETRFAPSDHRTYNRDGAAFNVGETFAGLPFARAVELAEALKPHVAPGWTLADFAQRWILDHPAVTTVITGASRPDQVRANARVSSLPPLPPATRAWLAAFYRDHVAASIRGPY